jgi:hypothetical protein
LNHTHAGFKPAIVGSNSTRIENILAENVHRTAPGKMVVLPVPWRQHSEEKSRASG